MIIAVDFDGTIVEHKYPIIGKERPFAITTLKKLQEEGNILILWTVREGELLDEAVEFCHKRGLDFYAVNSNTPLNDEPNVLANKELNACRKVNVDLFIDDRNVGGLPDWGVIYEMVRNNWTYDQYLHEVHNTQNIQKKSLLKKLFK